MAKLVTARGISHTIEQIISEAKVKIILVTPYLKIAKPLYRRLVQADNNGVEIILVYGKTELKDSQEVLISKLKNCRLLYSEHLHAKIYINENIGVTGSMNLYDYSEINNQELGVSFSRDLDTEIFIQAEDEIDLIIDSAELKKDFNSINNEEIIRSILDAYKNGKENFSLLNHPIKFVNINFTYGFITYNLEYDISKLEDIQERNFIKFQKALSPNYRVFWSYPYKKLSIYGSRKPEYLAIIDTREYKKTAIEIAHKIFIEDFEL